MVGRRKGVRHQKPERPGGCFAFLVPDPLFARDTFSLAIRKRNADQPLGKDVTNPIAHRLTGHVGDGLSNESLTDNDGIAILTKTDQGMSGHARALGHHRRVGDHRWPTDGSGNDNRGRWRDVGRRSGRCHKVRRRWRLRPTGRRHIAARGRHATTVVDGSKLVVQLRWSYWQEVTAAGDRRRDRLCRRIPA